MLIVLDLADPAQQNPRQFLETYMGPDPVCVALNKSDLGGSPETLRAALPALARANGRNLRRPAGRLGRPV